MLDVDVPSKLVLIEVIFVAEGAVRVHESYITKLVDISLLQMPTQSLIGVQFLLLKHTGFLFHANLTTYQQTYQKYLLCSSFRCFLRKATEGKVLSTLHPFPSILTKHLYSVSF